MNVWKLEFLVDDFDVFMTNDWSIDDIRTYDGRHHAESWVPVKVRRLAPRKLLELGDAPGFYSHIPVFSERAVEQLQSLIGDTVELLPIGFKKETFYAVNVLSVLDCMDYEKSIYKTFSDGRIMRFIKYEFIREKVEGQHIFKLVDLSLSYAYVSDEFKSIVESNGLQGFRFECVWSDNV